MVITRFWWRKLPRSCRLLLVSSVLFCPLLPSSVLFPFFGISSGFLRGSPFYYCCRIGYKLLQERSPVILSRMAKLERARFCAWLIEIVVIRCTCCFGCFSLLSRTIDSFVVIRCTCCFSCFPSSSGSIETTQTTLSLYFPDEPFFPFFMRSFFDCLPLVFISTCVFVKKIPSNRGETLILM